MLRDNLNRFGYIHRRDLIEHGWRADAIRQAVSDEGLTVARRQWILAGDAPAAIQLAARTGGRLTCVTAAEALGLWKPGHDPTPHIVLAPNSRSTAPGAITHRPMGIVDHRPRELIDPVANVLDTVARCLDYEDALAVWESALRTKSISGHQLHTLRWRGPLARRLAEDAGILSDSGLESLFVHRLARVGVILRQQVKIAGRHVDALAGARLVLQTDGFKFHVDARTRRSDIAHDRELKLLGYTVLRYDYHEIVNEWPRVEAEILAAIQQGLHLARLPASPAK